MNCALRKETVPERDLIFVTEPTWKYLNFRYRGDEIKRYAVSKNHAGILDRSPFLPLVLFTIVIRDEEIRQPKYLVLPRRSKFGLIKSQLKEQFIWLRDYSIQDFRLWRLDPE